MKPQTPGISRVKLAWMYLAVACCLATLVIKEIFLGAEARGLFFVPVVIALMAWSLQGQTSGALFESALILGGGLLTTYCFSAQANLVGNPSFWFMPIGLVTTLSLAPLFDREGMYAAGATGIWVVAYTMGQPQFASDVELAYAILMCVGSFAAAVYLCHVMSKVRRANSRLYKQMSHQATHDGLTGLLNRTSLLEEMAWEGSHAGQRWTCFAMVDIDNFKEVNDQHGHGVGDTVLKAVAVALRESNGTGLTGRLGGEEFGLCWGTAGLGVEEQAQAVVERVRTLDCQGIRPTISMGIAFISPGEDISGILKRADDALYQAKSQGKDRFVLSA